MMKPYGGTMWVAPVGTEPSDKGWRLLGHVSPDTLAFGYDGVLPKRISTSFTFTRKSWSPEVLRLYYGTDVYNNRGEARKEEKHMVVGEFEGTNGGHLQVAPDNVRRNGGVFLEVENASGASPWNWFEKADVPLIAHALFEQSGWPSAVKEGDSARRATVNGMEGVRARVRDQKEANWELANAIAALAAYNEWMEGEAGRKAQAEEAAKAAEEEARRKREHDELRTSPIAMEALKLYNAYYSGNSGTPYASWDAANHGKGTSDEGVRYWIRRAEAARAAKPVPKVGDRVRVSAEGVREACACWGGEVDGTVESEVDYAGVIAVRAEGTRQYVESKYVTILETAEEVERKAEIEKIQKVIEFSWVGAEHAYENGLRATK